MKQRFCRVLHVTDSIGRAWLDGFRSVLTYVGDSVLLAAECSIDAIL
ncbi:MAG: hypothetical protein IJ647_02475 [Prevotella sp.]|nr:hypothetical protein [Prevotella sp.]